ncbi:MAG: DUF1080 domain-containing protein [Dysgonamonadaceae bacterium]|jgi:HEAT repeat protein|nr:DUF1080 domain-containing protein [Dysgonamonadaceae bacterium]
MKKIYSILFVLLLSLGAAFAQYSANRTPATIIADVMAQIPAQNKQQYVQQQKDLLSTGESGILQLVKMLSASPESAVKAQYALNGLTAYATEIQQEDVRRIVANAYMKALDGLSDANSKAFIISLSGLVAKDEAISKLVSYLDDASLGNPSVKALVSINSPASQKALLDALNNVTRNQSKKSVILALAELRLPEAEKILIPLSGTPDLQESVIYALGQCGSAVSLPTLETFAEKAGYKPDKSGSVDAYIALIRRILAQGRTKEAEKAANNLLKKAGKAGQQPIREAALEIIFAVNTDNIPKLLQDALKEPSPDYRNAALKFALAYADNSLCNNLISALKKAVPEKKVEILNTFALLYNNPEKRNLADASQTAVFAGMLADNNREIKAAAATVLTQIGGIESINALSKLLNSADEQDIQLGKKALLSTQGNVASGVVTFIQSATDKGKIAILQILSARKSDAQGKIVFEQLNASSPDVKSAAYETLKDVATMQNLPDLYKLLEQSNAGTLAPVQQAIVAALKPLPKEKQFETISAQINKTDKSKQFFYYPVLSASGYANALNYIVERFRTGNGKDREAAFSSLLDWNGFESADELLSIARKGETGYAEKALNRYIQLVSSSSLTGENRRIFLTNAMETARTDAQKKEILKQLGQTNSYLGLLLAGSYLDNPAAQQEAAGAVMNIALNNKAFTGKKVKDLLEKTARVLNNPDAGYQREAIRKHLNEMPDEEDFVSIFNGKDLTGWKGLVENPIARAKMKPAELAKAQVKADEQMRKDWKVENGLLVFDGKGFDNICTEKQYGDFEMYVDWQLEPAPEADAGIYLRGTPQVQIWNTARTNVGAQVGSGGLYNNKSNPSKPLKLADNRLGEWNSLYIKMKGDRVTVFLNGELVVNNVILENYWDRTKPIFPVEQIELQAHGSKVYYRNIYMKELKSIKPFELSSQEKKEGYKILFDGTNMHQWTGNIVDYVLDDGCIAVYPKPGHNGGNLYTKGEYDNFVFRFEFQLTPAANNGVGIRAPMEGDNAYNAMEIQILDCEHPVYADIAPYQHHGSVYGVIAAEHGAMKPVGEWNEEEIYANGDHIRVTLNGKVILDGNIREAAKNGTVDHKDHPGLFNKTGHIGFLGHGNELKFRNIRIKELK